MPLQVTDVRSGGASASRPGPEDPIKLRSWPGGRHSAVGLERSIFSVEGYAPVGAGFLAVTRVVKGDFRTRQGPERLQRLRGTAALPGWGSAKFESRTKRPTNSIPDDSCCPVDRFQTNRFLGKSKKDDG